MDRLLEERIAKNDAIFRRANERISVAAETFGVDMPVPFVCECSAPECSEIVRLRLEDYEEIRADSRHFFHIPGHRDADGTAGVVVAERDGYVMVEKTGRAAEIAEALDERNPHEGLERSAADE
jgi:hypothetical protein